MKLCSDENLQLLKPSRLAEKAEGGARRMERASAIGWGAYRSVANRRTVRMLH